MEKEHKKLTESQLELRNVLYQLRDKGLVIFQINEDIPEDCDGHIFDITYVKGEVEHNWEA